MCDGFITWYKIVIIIKSEFSWHTNYPSALFTIVFSFVYVVWHWTLGDLPKLVLIVTEGKFGMMKKVTSDISSNKFDAKACQSKG